ncbi:MAG: hypothetical protein CL946_13760 [Ectothiorhodospiraceae bacterium]|nr:hypothetical protein [Ectothiorhodospiraceae bacterium]
MKRRIVHIFFGNPAKLPPLMHELRSVDYGSFDIALIAPDYHLDLERMSEQFPEVEFLPVRMRLREASAKQTAPLKLLRYAEFTIRAGAAIAKQRVDIVVAHDLPAALPTRLIGRKGFKLIYHAHELWSMAGAEMSPMMGLWRRVEQNIVQYVDGMIVPEPNRARIYREEYGAPAEPLVVRNIPPNVYEYAESDALRERLGLDGSAVIVLYQGLLTESRCIRELTEAVRHLPEEFQLALLGGIAEDYRQAIERIISQYGLQKRVHLMGSVPYEELYPLTCSAYIGCLLYRDTTMNNRYAAPNKLYEYLFAGLPLVASDVPGLRDAVPGFNCAKWCNPEEPESIAQAIAAATNLTKGRLLADAAKERFSWQQEWEKLLQLYSGALHEA